MSPISNPKNHPTNQHEYYAMLRAVPIESIAREVLAGRIENETGSRLECNCPRHTSSSKTSLHININEQTFFCFACQVGGDGIQLIEFIDTGQITKGVRGEMPQSHRSARDKLAAMAGLPPLQHLGLSLEEIAEWERQQREADHIFGVLEELTNFYHVKLWNSLELEAVKNKYGLSQEIIERQRIGYSNNKGVIEHMISLGYTEEDLIASGCWGSDYQDKLYPVFVNRWMFPYWHNSRCVYLIGRETPNTLQFEGKDGKPANRGSKYFKLPTFDDLKHPKISKTIDNSVLFNEDAANSKEKFVVITEGVTDCLTLIDKGYQSFSPITVRFKDPDLKRVIPRLKNKVVYIANDNEVSKVGEDGALDTCRKLEQEGIEARIVTFTLTEDQRRARDEIQEKFGISITMDKKEVAEAVKKLTEEQKQEYDDLAAQGKQDGNSFFLTFSAEDFQKLLDEAPTRLGLVIKARIPMIEAKDKAILNDDIFFSALRLCRQTDMALYAEVMEMAGKLKWTNMFKEKMKNLKASNYSDKPDESSPLTTFKEDLAPLNITVPEGCDGMVVPAYHHVTPEGSIEYRKELATQVKREFVYPAPILVTRQRQDFNTGEYTIEIKVYSHKHHRWDTHIVKREFALNPRKATMLANLGMSVSGENAGPLTRYIQQFEITNADHIPSDEGSGQLGWLKPESETPAFLYGETCLGNSEICFVPKDAGDLQLRNGLRPSGSKEVWLDLGAEIIPKYPQLAIVVYGAAAAPLLTPLGLRTFIVDHSAPTSSGKSTENRFAISAYGDPSKLIRTWNATTVGLEQIAATLKDLPLVLDDTKSGNIHKFAQIAYHFTEETGKFRGSKFGGLATTLNWKTVVLTTGEASLADYIKEGGGKSRIFPIKGMPFGPISPESRKLVMKIDQISSTNNGHIGPEWIQYIIDNRSKWEEWQNRYYEINNRMVTSSGPAGRFANTRALITITAELIHEAGIFPWEFCDPFDEIWEDTEEAISDADIGPRSLQEVFTWTLRFKRNFYGQHIELQQRGGELVKIENRPPQGWFGVWEDKPTWKWIAFAKSALEPALQFMGFQDPEACYAAWDARGWLKKNGRKRTKPIRLEGSWTRMIVISRQAIAEAVGIDPGSTEALEEETRNNPKIRWLRPSLDELAEKYRLTEPAADGEEEER